MLRIAATWTLPLLLAGCAGIPLSAQDADIPDTPDTGFPATDPEEAPPTDGLPEPSWFTVEGILLVEEGEAHLEGSSLEITFQAAPEESGSEEVPPVACTPEVLTLEPDAAPEEGDLLGWWALTSDTTSCPYPLPEPLYLGIGPLDPQLHAAMALAELEVDGSTLYGLYTRFGAAEAPLWVFGLAGTQGHFDGAVEPVADPPLEDGPYLLTTLHLLPIPE